MRAKQSMVFEIRQTIEMAELRAVINGLTKAVRNQDVEAMLEHCCPDVAVFDMVPPLKHEGIDTVRRLWSKTFAAFEPPIEYELHDLEITIGDVAAFCRSVNRFGGTSPEGKRNVSWICSTLGFRKLNGRWKVVHQHVSVPFDMETGRALLTLTPERE